MENVFFSHKKDDWSSPSYIYKFFANRGFYDPCPLFCEKDALSYDWPKLCYVNPPYSKLIDFVNYSCEQVIKNGCKIVMLLPSRTETKWFKRLYLFGGSSLCFVHGRLKFGGVVEGLAPFGSVLVFLGWKGFPKTIYHRCHDGADIARIASILGI